MKNNFSIEINELHPLPHETLKGHWRVPVQYVDPNYIVFAGHNFTRTFSENTIPAGILSKLTMARASDKSFLTDNALTYLDVFYYPHDDSMGDVGWRVTETMYIVILEERELRSLLGIEELMDKFDWEEDNDTRRKSKSKGKENLK